MITHHKIEWNNPNETSDGEQIERISPTKKIDRTDVTRQKEWYHTAGLKTNVAPGGRIASLWFG